MGEAGGGSPHGSCSSTGESDEHLKWKNFAAERLFDVFGDAVEESTVEKRLAAPKSGREYRQGDAVVTFQSDDPELGQGIVVEVQHKNDSKDILATTRDYINQGYAVVWADKDDFSEKHCRLNETDIRRRAFESAQPLARERVSQAIHSSNQRIITGNSRLNITGVQKSVPATLPSEWFDEQARRIWAMRSWSELFSPPENHVSVCTQPPVKATILRGWFDFYPTVRDVWRSAAWDGRFNPPRDYVRVDSEVSKTGTIPFAEWFAHHESPQRDILKQAYLHGLKERSSRIRKTCPGCNDDIFIRPPLGDEIQIAARCSNCGDWVTVKPTA